MNDLHPTVPWRQNGIRNVPRDYDDSGDFEDLPSATDTTAGLISLGFIGSTLRRTLLVWLTLAVIGLFVGVGLRLDHKSTPTATTTLLLDTTGNALNSELPTDIAIIQSIPVATAVVKQLGIQEPPVAFLGTYSAAASADSVQILTITADGPTANAAVQRASAIAQQFLAFRTRYLQQGLKQTIDSVNQQVSQAQQHLNSVENQISQVSAEPASPSQQAQLGTLATEKTDASNALYTERQDASSTQLEDQTTTDQEVNGSEVLSAPVVAKASGKKEVLMYGVGGLFGGLVLGMVIVIIGAITTDRLRRRDDIAIAVGAPVRLSVGRLRRRRWMPELRPQSSQRNRDMELVVGHLRNAVPADSKGATSLAVVAADDAPSVAQAVVKLAIASSQQRKRVVLADLSAGAPAARELGVTAPGIDTVNPEGVPIVVVIPEASDIAPVGPLRNPQPESAHVNKLLMEVYASADLVLSLVTLDPAFGGDYLGTWATDAVVVVTAGQSTATLLHATGEMIRLAGIRLDSVVVLDADKGDESLGTVIADYQPASTLTA